MRYNDKIAPMKTWENYKKSFPTSIPKEQLQKIEEQFRYVQDAQERRSQAYSMLQEAKRRNLSIDDFVDSFTNNNVIVDNAPENLRCLGLSYTPENIKKFMKNFLSITSPVGVGFSSLNNN